MVILPFALALFFPGMLAGTRPAAHPLHTTMTEIVQPVPRGGFTITIRGFEDDLAAAARVETPTAPADSAIGSYLQRRAVLTDRNGRSVALNAVGLRRSGGVIWLTFRSGRPVDLDGSRFINEALTDVFHDQVNLVQVRIGRSSRMLMFTPGDGAKPVAG